ncbi:MAG: sugar transferase [Candidatus Aureabacteria bacterium]|nr:sugar transferase [Candidatus Auribacterota bacterium]
MVYKKENFFKQLMTAVDFFFLYITLFFSYFLTLKAVNFSDFKKMSSVDLNQICLILIPVAAFWVICLRAIKAYSSFRRKSGRDILKDALITTSLSIGFFSILAFLLRFSHDLWMHIICIIFLSGMILFFQKFFFSYVFKILSHATQNQIHLLIVGTGKRAQKFISLIEKHGEWGYKIIGCIDDVPGKVGTLIKSYPILGCLDDLPDILDRETIDEAAFIVPRNWLAKIEDSILECEIRGIKTTLAADIFNLRFARPVVADFDGLPTIQYATTTEDMLQLFVKQTMDLFISTFLIILLFPFYVLIAIIIKLESRGPVFFMQKRAGLNGKEFNMFKFRTMFEGSEEQRDSFLDSNEMDGPVFKMKDDPRLTRFGKLLRKTSLDEFPQLINVFKGEMSLVGPRPLPLCEASECRSWQKRRTSMKPGMTCIWQVSGRNNISFKNWVKMDLEYIDCWSLLLDIKILLQTIPAVFRGHGAY